MLKSPQHLEQIPALLATFPDATFAITHRDPVSVIQSAATMLAYGDRMRRAEIEPEALAEYWVDRVDRLLRACVRDRDLLPPDRTVDVMFHEFMADDVGMVERIYERARSPHDRRCARAARRASWPRTPAASTAASPTTSAATSASTPRRCGPASTTTSSDSPWPWRTT